MRKILFLLIFILSSSATSACEPKMQSFSVSCDIKDIYINKNISCVDEDCSFNITSLNPWSSYIHHRDIPEDIYLNELNGIVFNRIKDYHHMIDYNDLYSMSETVCSEDINVLEPIFEKEIKNWISENKGYFLSGDLVFEPFSSEREIQLIYHENSLKECYYFKYKSVGDWLLFEFTTREYCYLEDDTGGMCPKAKISHPKFFIYLLLNPSLNGLLYLGIYIIILVLIGGLVYYVYRRVRK